MVAGSFTARCTFLSSAARTGAASGDVSLAAAFVRNAVVGGILDG
jgi:hypothetical protein